MPGNNLPIKMASKAESGTVKFVEVVWWYAYLTGLQGYASAAKNVTIEFLHNSNWTDKLG